MEYNLNLSKFLPHQKAVAKSNSKITALVGGYGSGKSIAAALALVLGSIQNPGCMNMGVSPNYRMARNTLQPAIFRILEEFFEPGLIEGKDFTFHQSFHTFKIRGWNGRIILGSAEIPSSLKGANLATAVLDEPGIMDFKAYQQMIARIRDPRAKKIGLTLCGTPEDLNWYYDICEGEKKPLDLTLIRAKTRDNIHLPPDYIENLEQQYDPQLVKAYLDGLFVNLKGSLAYHSFHQDNILQEGYEYNPDLPIIISMDFNWNPNTAVIAQENIIAGKRRIIVFDEFFSDCATEIKCERIIDKYGQDKTYEIFADNSSRYRNGKGVGISDEVIVRNSFNGIRYNFFLKSANPKRRDRLNAVNGVLLNAQGDRRILITPNCKNLLNDFRRITIEEFENISFNDPSLGHISDALGYFIDYRYPIRNRNAGASMTSRFTL